MKVKGLYFLILIFSTLNISHADDMNCSGMFPNPITDICWEGMFPIKVGGFEVGADQGGLPPESRTHYYEPVFNQ